MGLGREIALISRELVENLGRDGEFSSCVVASREKDTAWVPTGDTESCGVVLLHG